MAMNSGAATSNVLIAFGAGLAGSIVRRNDQVSDALRQILELAKSVNEGQISPSDSDSIGKITSLILPAAAIGAVGYCYIKLKALSFSDVMFVTKQHMANAVASVSKPIEQVSDALAATKRHLTHRLETLDRKIDEQREVSEAIMHEVYYAKNYLSEIGSDIKSIQQIVAALGGKLDLLEKKQDVINDGIWYLCQVARGIKYGLHAKFFKEASEKLKPNALTFSEATEKLKGLYILAEDMKLEENIDLDLNKGITLVKDGDKPMAKGIAGPIFLGSDQLSDVSAQIVELAENVDEGKLSPGYSDSIGKITSFILPAAAVSAVGYSYIKLKGLSFPNVMYVTKQDMANAVAIVSKQLGQVSDSLAATKRHLDRQLEELDGKIEEQLKFSNAIMHEVNDIKTVLCQIGSDIESIQQMVAALEGKLGILEKKQDATSAGIWYLCQVASGIKDARDAKFFQEACEKMKPNAVSSYEATEKLKGLHIEECIDLDLNKGNTKVNDSEKPIRRRNFPTDRAVHRTYTINLASIKGIATETVCKK